MKLSLARGLRRLPKALGILAKTVLIIVGIPLALLLLIGGCSAVERYYLTTQANEFCDRFDLGTSFQEVEAFVGKEAMAFAYINEEWGYRFRWWDLLGVGAEACSLWFEEGKLHKKRQHADLA